METNDLILLCEKSEILPIPFYKYNFFQSKQNFHKQYFKIYKNKENEYFKMTISDEGTYLKKIREDQALYLSHPDYPKNEYTDSMIQVQKINNKII